MSANHVYDRAGLAAISDLERPEARALFARLEAEQRAFLAVESRFRSGEYKWPREPLYQWSRCWEYPWVYHQLATHKPAGVERPLVVDVGPGVTFFPFAVAKLGYRVIGTDVDPVCVRELSRAADSGIDASPGAVEGCRATDGKTLPFGDAEADAVACVSVLEHIPTPDRTLDEIARILKPGGLFVLTMDLDALGNSEIGPEAHRRLVEQLDARFRPIAVERTIHPADVLLSDRGPYPLQAPPGVRGAWFHAKQRLIKPALGRTPVPPGGVLLAVHALVLVKR